jgi:hypothetical protein
VRLWIGPALALAALASAGWLCQIGGGSSMDHYDDGQIAFDYPGGWQTLEEIWGFASGVGVVDPNSRTPFERYSVSFTVETWELPEGMTASDLMAQHLEQTVIETFITDGWVTVDGVDAVEVIYQAYSGEPLWQVRELWLEQGGIVYVLTCKSFPDDYAGREAEFDAIIASFDVK